MITRLRIDVLNPLSQVEAEAEIDSIEISLIEREAKECGLWPQIGDGLWLKDMCWNWDHPFITSKAGLNRSVGEEVYDKVYEKNGTVWKGRRTVAYQPAKELQSA